MFHKLKKISIFFALMLVATNFFAETKLPMINDKETKELLTKAYGRGLCALDSFEQDIKAFCNKNKWSLVKVNFSVDYREVLSVESVNKEDKTLYKTRSLILPLNHVLLGTAENLAKKDILIQTNTASPSKNYIDSFVKSFDEELLLAEKKNGLFVITIDAIVITAENEVLTFFIKPKQNPVKSKVP